MAIWIWPQPGNKAWKVVSDYKAGTIKVYDEKGNLLMKKRDLSEAAIKVIEKNFFNVVAEDDGIIPNFHENNPMYG